MDDCEPGTLAIGEPARDAGIKGLLIAAGLAGFQWSLLALRIPFFKPAESSFWIYRDKPLATAGWLVAAAVGAVGAVTLVERRRVRAGVVLPVLIAMGFFIQIAFAMVEGRGMEAMRERMVTMGHAEFAKVAASQESALEVARNYEELVRAGSLGKYCQSKPPGQLLFYMGVEKASHGLMGGLGTEERYRSLVAVSSWLFPLLTYLALVPLYFLARLVMDARGALRACLLFLFIPSVTLITLHLDQALYPTLFLGPLALLGWGARRAAPWMAALGGAAAYLAFYVSFSLAPLAMLAPACLIAVLIQQGGSESAKRAAGRAAVGFVFGFLVLFAAFGAALDYNMILRYRRALESHHAWKGAMVRSQDIAHAAWSNLAEIALWAGLPLAWIFVDRAVGAVASAVGRRLSPAGAIEAATLAAFAFLAFFGKTYGEVARLWIFMLPLVCIAGAGFVGENFARKRWRAMAVLVALQCVTLVLFKRFQDF